MNSGAPCLVPPSISACYTSLRAPHASALKPCWPFFGTSAPSCPGPLYMLLSPCALTSPCLIKAPRLAGLSSGSTSSGKPSGPLRNQVLLCSPPPHPALLSCLSVHVSCTFIIERLSDHHMPSLQKLHMCRALPFLFSVVSPGSCHKPGTWGPFIAACLLITLLILSELTIDR